MSDGLVGANAPFVYDQEYYSGTQAAVYIGDVFVDEVTSFAFQAQQNKTPIYGYASQLFDAITRGPVIIRGSFRINFKEAGYLWLILERWAHHQGTGTPFHPSKDKQKATLDRMNIERIMSQPSNNEEKTAFYNGLAGYVSEAQANKDIGLDAAENYFEEFEDMIWGRPATLSGESDINSMARRADDHRLNGFDLFLQFGNWVNDYANHTIIKLTQVHILSSQMVVDANGKPVEEEYSFLARNRL